MTKSFIPELTAQVNDFVAERDWEQFHSPKNLAMAMIVEAAELVYLVCLADRLEINLEEAVLLKMRKNRAKYPADKARGNARKYSEF